MRPGLAGACLLMAGNVAAAAPTDTPRVFAFYDGIEGYDEFAAERFGAPDKPRADELGTLLILRMFRNVCFGIEAGAALDDVMPPLFSAYPSLSYEFGEGPAEAVPGDPVVLSSTGDAIEDEDGGHPAISLSPNENGMTCTIRWRFVDGSDVDNAMAMASVLSDWMPYSFSLIPATRPQMGLPASPLGFGDWDRPCLDRYCPVTVIYDFPDGFNSIETTLNITGIGGGRP